jgi:protein gp37
MSQHSSIEWTDASWNPVTGCTKVSPGCKHCYAETFAERFRGVSGHPYEQGFDLRLWSERLTLPLSWKGSRRIFVNSMSDLFHPGVPEDFIDRVFDTMLLGSWHQYQVLTKRPERMAAYLDSRRERLGELRTTAPQIWLGASVETQAYVHRARVVSQLPSAVRFLSCEPLLGPLDLNEVLGESKVNWVIVGGESGHGARAMDPAWLIALRDQCRAAGVAFFFKQWGGRNKKAAGRQLEGRAWDEFPTSNDAKGYR